MSGHPVEQAIRRAHCSHADRDAPTHQCAGTCTITPKGVDLSCRLCGDQDHPIAPSEMLPEVRLVLVVLRALGIDYRALSPEYQARAANAARDWLGTRRFG